MNTHYMDTESCQFIGATILIQHTKSTNLSDIKLHDVFGSPAGLTCKLIEKLMDSRLVGFNLTHDFHHLNRTYNICKMYPYMMKPEEDLSYWLEVEKTEEARKYCLLPKKAVDLMIMGQRSHFQAMIKQKPIRITKIPKLLAKPLIDELYKRIKLNSLYFAGRKKGLEWKIKPLWAKGTPKAGKEIGNEKDAIIDPELVNIELPFKPKRGLKDVIEHILKKKVIHFEPKAQKYREFFWYPTSGYWIDVFHDWLNMWRHDRNQRVYAADDIRHLIDLDKFFKYPDEDFGSLLACMVGNLYWKGYDINPKIALREKEKAQSTVEVCREKVDFRSPKKSLNFLLEKANPIFKQTITNTEAEVLNRLARKNFKNVSDRAQIILDGRHADKRLTLLNRLLEAGKLYAMFKVSGTGTNRMAGGTDESMEGRSESINPQGIPHEKEFREIFTFMNHPAWTLSGGDAISFEVSIAAAVFGDDNLTKEIDPKQNNKKFHAIFGSFIYNKSYEEILETKNLEGIQNLYDLAKTGVFAWFYGGTEHTIAENMNIDKEQVIKGLVEMEKTYPGIKRARERIWSLFEALTQPGGIGTQVQWREPEKKIKTFLGFERDFTVEVECMRAIFNLSQKMPQYLVELGKQIRVTRREDRGEQKGHGALMSALYGGAFQIQSKIMKIASNFVIQSPGGEMLKLLQYEIVNKYQPRGINEYNIITFNKHDELVCAHRRGLEDSLERTVNEFVLKYQKYVPLFEMDWNKNKRNWAETH